MTREEAIEIGRAQGWGASFVDTLVALDILKLDEPKSTEEKAYDALGKEFGLDRERIYWGMKALDEAGLKIVEKDQ